MENFSKKWSLTKVVKCFEIKWCTKWRKTFKIEKVVVLAEHFQHQADCNRVRRKIGQSKRSHLWRSQSYLFTLPYQRNGNHTTESSTVGHVILRTALERYFRFYWNCKQLRVELRNSMPNCEIYFSIFSENIHTNLKIYSQPGVRRCR